MPEKEYKPTEDVLKTGEEQGFFQVSEGRVKYLYMGKSYKITDPEEQVRAAFYLELIKKYQYPKERIDFEVVVPRRKPEDKADIVVYEDDERKSPFLVVECKKDGITDAEYKQAIEQVFGNANSLRAKYAAVIAGTTRTVFTVEGFKAMERDKNVIADVPVKYGKAPTYRFIKGDPEKEIKPVTQCELKRALEKCHDTVWQGGRLAPTTAFDEISKLLFCKLQDEKEGTTLGKPYSFQVGSHETAEEIFARIDGIYKLAKKRDEVVFKEDIKLEPPIVYAVVEHLQSIAIGKTDLDVKGAAFEYFMQEFFKGKMGQFFTPRNIIDFAVTFLEPKHNEFILDPACGSGGFLLHAMDFVRRKSEKEYSQGEAYKIWHDFAMKNLCGIEINDQIARVCKMNMIVHDDGHTNVIGTDALRNFDEIEKIHPSFRKERFDIILTNPPFGATVKDSERPYLPEYELGSKIKPSRKKQKTEILFIERCIDYVRPGGRIGIVLPDGILTNSSLQYVRDLIIKKAQILAVVSLPQFAFSHYGAGVKASLLFLRKWEKGEDTQKNYPIFMSIAEHIGYDATGRPDKDEFPDILKAWQEFRKTNKIDFFVNAPLCFAIGRGEVERRFDPCYYGIHPIKSKYTLIPLKDVAKVQGGYAFKSTAYQETGIPLLRIQNIDEGSVDLSDTVYLPDKYKDQYKEFLLKQNDIVIAMTGATIGKVGILEKKLFCLLNQRVGRFLIDCSKINTKYLFAYLSLRQFKNQIIKFSLGGAQPNISGNAIESIVIPLPPREIQDKIAIMMDEAYRLKKEKETEAEKLINSIDAYVLNELGIKLPQIKEEKNFSVTFDKIRGKRFDPFHYLDFNILKTIDKGEYPAKKLIEITKLIESGQRPKGGVRHIKEGVISIGGEHINREGAFDLSQPRYVPGSFFNTLTKGKIQVDDVLVVKDGATTGKTAIVAEGFPYENACVNEHVFRIVAKDDIVPIYLFAVLFSTIGQRQINRVISGAAQKGIVLETISEVLIPIPPLSVQQEIAQEVKSRREKAKELKEGAKELLEKAKREVEELIEKK